MIGILALALSALCVLIGTWLSLNEVKRGAKEVALDLLSDEEDARKKSAVPQKNRVIIASFILAVILAVVLTFIVHAKPPVIIIPSIILFASGIIIDGRLTEFRKQKIAGDIEYYIPVIMERLVMAVESGLDIIPAVKAVVELEEEALSHRTHKELDPVSTLFKRVITLTEQGLSFDDALKTVSEESTANSLKHCFIHLAIAFKEGGELVSPLRELSDATQLHYQESVEEDIAKLPVKATLPLVLTFAGLMTFFLATPLIQILSFATKAVPK